MELVAQILAELLIQILAEAAGNCIGHALARDHRSGDGWRSNPILAAIGYVLLGALCGGISLLLLQRPIFTSEIGQILALIGTTFAMGAMASGIGYWRRHSNRDVVRIDRFMFGALLGFAFGLVRFFAGP